MANAMNADGDWLSYIAVNLSTDSDSYDMGYSPTDAEFGTVKAYFVRVFNDSVISRLCQTPVGRMFAPNRDRMGVRTAFIVK